MGDVRILKLTDTSAIVFIIVTYVYVTILNFLREILSTMILFLLDFIPALEECQHNRELKY